MGRATLPAGVVAVTLIALGSILPLTWGLGLIAVLMWFALPGVALARRLYGPHPGGWIAALLVGPAWGYVASSLVLLGLWASGIRSFALLMLAPLPAVAAVWPARRLASMLSSPTFTRRDVAAVAFVLLAVLAIVGRPYSRVGIDLPEGRAYRAYFTADFVWAMTVVSEVSKGDMPPRNPFYVNDSLHYYWLTHLLPAVEHRAAGEALSVDQLLLVNALWVGLAFGAFLYFFVRHFVKRPWAAAIACAGVLFCSSFEGLERIWTLSLWRHPFDALRSVNIDAVGNWYYRGMKVDGLHRALLWQPQHQIGYLLGFSGLLFLVQARDWSRPGLLFLVGLFLGASMLIDPVPAAMLTIAAAAFEAYHLVRARRWKAFLPCALAAAVPLAAALALSSALEYVDTAATGNPLVHVGVNRLAAHRVALTMFLNFGPVLIVALFGVAAALWQRETARFVPVAIVLMVCAVFYFFVDVPEHDSVYVAWRASHLSFMALAALCGYGLQEWWARGGWARWSMSAVAVSVALAAVPTVLIDIYNAQDVSNRAMGPGFRWTVVLSPAELEGLTWIKQNTPPQARVQIEPYSRARDAYYVTSFAERRMAGGLPTGLIPLAKYQKASSQLKDLYMSTSARDAHERSLGLCVDYLVIGQPEREGYKQIQPLIDESPHLFRRTFRNDALAIYAVSGPWDRQGCPH